MRHRYDDWKYIERGIHGVPNLGMCGGDAGVLRTAAAICYVKPQANGLRGRPEKYSRELMVTLCIARLTFGIKYRQLEGFAIATVGRENAPDHTTIAYHLRQMKLTRDDLIRAGMRMPEQIGNTRRAVVRLAVDGTGIGATSGGDWRYNKHGGKKRYIQLVIVIDVDDLSIVSAEITTDSESEPKIFPRVFEKALKNINAENTVLLGDKAYDDSKIYERCEKEGVELIVPVRKNASGASRGRGNGSRLRAQEAREQLGGSPPPRHIRDVDEPERKRNQQEWKKVKKYGKRWHIEIAFAIFKTIFGGAVMARKMEYAANELTNKMIIYNAYRAM